MSPNFLHFLQNRRKKGSAVYQRFLEMTNMRKSYPCSALGTTSNADSLSWALTRRNSQPNTARISDWIKNSWEK
jgi:hypothetical protein